MFKNCSKEKNLIGVLGQFKNGSKQSTKMYCQMTFITALENGIGEPHLSPGFNPLGLIDIYTEVLLNK